MLRFLLIFFLILVLVFYWRNRHTRDDQSQTKSKSKPMPSSTPAIEMVACAHCGLHLARDSAVQGRKSLQAWYCGEPHRRLSERA
jgi:uncharacterized protein